MSYVKNILNKYVILCFILVLLILSIIILYIKNSKELYFITIPTDYSFILNDKTALKINIGCSKDNTMFLSKDAIENIYIYNGKNDEKYQFDLKEVSFQTINKYDKKDFYFYQLELFTNIQSNDLINIENAYFLIIFIYNV